MHHSMLETLGKSVIYQVSSCIVVLFHPQHIVAFHCHSGGASQSPEAWYLAPVQFAVLGHSNPSVGICLAL